ncbi:MAG: phospholipid carrier-dependent glycosyltransferase [Bacteroidetes bacterium]|jgi:hypothetical protein|nr:phospholipid carrier-dependent glycosyltransferase [Bacteroidota bacterium]
MRNNIATIESLNSKKNLLFFALLSWFIVNLLQSFFTELAHDEAYYWMYSRHLDWGYYDHPPMVALLIKIGYTFFQNELGVRILFVLLGTLSVYNIYKITNPENPVLFFAILFSILLVHGHFAGFLALPDIPLIFFTTCFLRLYKKYLLHDQWITAILTGITIACMFYSKYHAVLIIFLVVISNFSLFRRISFYAIILLVATALIPHLMWQINHQFPSVNYHLTGRSSPDYSVSQTLDYLINQPLIAGPLTGVVLLYHSFIYKTNNLYEKSLKFILVGFYLFFLIMTLKGRVEAHWLAAAIIPLVVISYKKIQQSLRLRKIIYTLSLVSVLLFVVMRFMLVTNFIPNNFNYRSELHNWDLWAQEIDSASQQNPVVFTDKFQFPSKYTFYTGNFATTLNSIFYRNNQFDIWNFEDSLQGKTIMLCRSDVPSDTIYTSVNKEVKYSIIHNFRSFFNSVHINARATNENPGTNDSIEISLDIINKTDDELVFNNSGFDSTYLAFTIFTKGEIYDSTTAIRSVELSPIPAFDTSFKYVKLPPIPKTGNYEIVFSMDTEKLQPARNGSLLKLNIN